MGALEMGLSEEELPPLVDAWRQANPNITKLWWDVDRAAMEAVRYKHTNETHGIDLLLQERDAVYYASVRQTACLCKAQGRHK
ncbi:MAG: hypothetical protein ACOX1U_04200 [Saccharofermentanales bacterium]